MLDRTMGKLVPLSDEQLQEVERQLREGAWTAETIEIFKAEIQSKPEDETDKGLLALCELALKGLNAPLPYVRSEPWSPGDETEVKCETAGNIVNDLTIDCDTHRCGHIKNGVSFNFGRRGPWVLDYEHLKAAYDLATRIRERRSISGGE